VEQQDITANEDKKRQIWSQPWKYAESLIITFNILVLGFAIEAISGGTGVKVPGFPVNIFIIIIFGIILTFLHLKFRNRALIKWLSGIPAAISSILAYSILVLLLGFIPQDMAQPSVFLKITGLWHVKNSWPFFLIEIYFLIILGFVTLRRAIPFKVKNIGFLLNHFGLWLTLLASGLSSSDLQTLTVNLYENEKESNIAVTDKGDKYELPFSLKLLDFNIIEYNPQIGVYDIEAGKFLMGKAQSMPFVKPNLETELGDWHLKVLNYFSQALYKNGTLQPTDSSSGYPAALVFAKNIFTGDTARGWISSGSVFLHPDYMALKGNQYLILNAPEPKKFYSKLVVFRSGQKTDTVQIEVNKPYSVAGWSIYQTGYNEQMRKWSNLSVVEAVRDPWLPVVYTGIFLLLAGAVYMFWIGKDKKE
jgi:hypothetical protein